MRTLFLSIAAALAVVGLLAGCGKANQPPAGTPPPQGINATEFRPTFAAASPEIKAVVDDVMMSIQSSAYDQTLRDLAKLAANPALTETQRKAVSVLTDQVKQKLAGMAGPPK